MASEKHAGTGPASGREGQRDGRAGVAVQDQVGALEARAVAIPGGEGLSDAEGKSVVPGIFAAVPYCIDLIGGPYLQTDDAVCQAFRPKTAIRSFA